jgi:hypothetical protein
MAFALRQDASAFFDRLRRQMQWLQQRRDRQDFLEYEPTQAEGTDAAKEYSRIVCAAN